MSVFGCVTLKTLTLAFLPWTASPSGVREAAGDYQHAVAGRLWARFPGPGVGVIVSHTCVKSLCKCIPPPSPSPVGGCQNSALQRWPLRGLVCVPAAPFMCVAQLCAESLTWLRGHVPIPCSCLVRGDQRPTPTVAAVVEKTSQQGT